MVSHEYTRADARSPPERYDRGLKEEKQRSSRSTRDQKKSRALNGHRNVFTRKKTYRKKQFLFPLLALVCVLARLTLMKCFRVLKTKLNLVSRAFDPLFILLLGRTNPPPMKKRRMLLHNYEMIFHLSKASPL